MVAPVLTPDGPLRGEIKRIIVEAKNERHLVDLIEALVLQEVQGAIQHTKHEMLGVEDLSYPDGPENLPGDDTGEWESPIK
jgi:hypothetical protein